MTRPLLYRLLTVLGAVLLAVVYLVPSLTGDLPRWWKATFPTSAVRLGLDLQGGMHLILEVQTEKAVQYNAERIAEELKRGLRDQRVPVSDVVRDGRDGVIVRVPEGAALEPIVEYVSGQFPTLVMRGDSGDSRRIRFTIDSDEAARIRAFAVDQSLETIRNRIDQLGLTEPVIQRSGSESILVQLPGETDPERAKSIIGRTAILKFQLLAGDKSVESVVGADHPCGLREPERSRALTRASSRAGARHRVLCGLEDDLATGRSRAVPYLVESRTLMTGEVITDARPRPDTNLVGSYLVELVFDSRGASVFEDITAQNVGRQLAIVLDDTVYSAPRIQERIGGGRAVITGSFSIRDARDLAIILRAGALPAPVTIAEERTVGPTLGHDSIEQGLASFLIGAAAVIAFMAVYYRGAGLIADLALIGNISFLIACLAAFEATLTLPGIAGIVLTLGMAVDANVLIIERIREELRNGKTARAAVEAGYERALPAILDSNLTTFLSGLILFQFGSGPVRGFAVTLCMGIVTSVFAAVFCTRTLYDFLLQGRWIRNLSV